ncbi:MAG: hypothetical protein K2F78_05900 [Muribaculaceae bacterium]|nr:hypothetical protein [Muribaculaceae bacterium]
MEIKNERSGNSRREYILPFAGGILFVCICIACFLIGRSGRQPADDSHWHSAIDSLHTVIADRESRYNSVQAALDTLASAIDSVSIAEGQIMLNSDPETGRRFSRREMKERIEQLGHTIARQQKRISELENQLGKNVSDTASITNLRNIIARLRVDIREKETQIARMQTELASNRRTIASMQDDMNRIGEEMAQVQQENQNIKEALETQNRVINECYVAIGTASELADKGILSGGGLFKKRQLQPENFSPAQFQCVDISLCTEIPVHGKKVKILTAMPSGSYRITGSKGSWTLVITDPTAFWSVSNYLVIQTN